MNLKGASSFVASENQMIGFNKEVFLYNDTLWGLCSVCTRLFDPQVKEIHKSKILLSLIIEVLILYCLKTNNLKLYGFLQLYQPTDILYKNLSLIKTYRYVKINIDLSC